MFYLGIDIAKVNHVASLIGEDGSILVKAIKFTNSNEGLQKLIESISGYDQSQIYCAMEATGDYWLSLFSALTDKDFNVSVFNPYQIKSFRGAYSNRKQKNDVIDSVIIADFLRFNGIDQTCLPNDDLLALKNLTRYRSNLVNNISKAKNIKPEINVIGYNVDEAIFVIDKFLDDCSLAKLQNVRIVHGKGTGKLRNGIHQFLKTNPHVKSFRLGTFGEGEMGVTIVELR